MIKELKELQEKVSPILEEVEGHLKRANDALLLAEHTNPMYLYGITLTSVRETLDIQGELLKDMMVGISRQIALYQECPGQNVKRLAIALSIDISADIETPKTEKKARSIIVDCFKNEFHIEFSYEDEPWVERAITLAIKYNFEYIKIKKHEI